MASDPDWRTRRVRRPLPLWSETFLCEAQHLAADEVGAYLLILMAMWMREGCDLPDDDRRLARLCRVSPRLWRSRIGPAVCPFFEAADGMLTSKRLRSEAEQIERQYRDKRTKPRPAWRSSDAARSSNRMQQGTADDSAPTDRRPLPSPPGQSLAAVGDDPADYEAILTAAAIDWTGDVTGKWMGSTQRWHAQRWRELGLSPSEILAVIAESRPRGGPPSSLAYFDAAMRRAVGRKAEAPLSPGPSGPNFSSPSRPHPTLSSEAFIAALNRDA